ncbi:reverse transcriptase [Cucumis melo var. makuwa]|uniref:Reverse transcriptase n=1 Tax=Cucumis melo var. makuwa TaxID=1194695 RepID=A0A5A7U4L2_CUCMM|nr:reverse transcriptase [Cucumis melo var. makuwa]TYK08574.1 reverse transcriptase [Cucumis melo var. makuwa]
MVPPTALPTPVHEYEPTQAQGTTELNNNNLCVEDDIVDVVEDDRTNMMVPNENKTARSNETLIKTRDTRSCTKQCNYMSYSNLSPKFKAFTASFDTATILKNIHEAMESPEWKVAAMEEMGALEKNKTLGSLHSS